MKGIVCGSEIVDIMEHVSLVQVQGGDVVGVIVEESL